MPHVLRGVRGHGGVGQRPRPRAERAEAEARRFFGISGAMYFGGGYLFAMIALAGIATKTMSNAPLPLVQLNVPLVVEAKSAKSWAEAH